MLNRQKNLEREALLRRHREQNIDTGQLERDMREMRPGYELRSTYG
jgi:hypothetical protein